MSGDAGWVSVECVCVEAVASYRQMSENIRQMTKRHPQFRETARDSVDAVRQGFPAVRLNKTARMLSVDRGILLRVLGVSERTVQRKYVTSGRLSQAVSDRLSRIDRIYALAVDVFGDTQKAAAWLKRPSRALGKELPLQLLDTDAGTERVERELRQIQYGFVY